MNQKEIEETRKIYLRNRQAILNNFEASLEEIKKENPSVSGKIAGMDFQQFSATMIFNTIVEQEDYANQNSPYIDKNEEKIILKDLIKKAKKAFGKEYGKWYDHAKQQ